MNPPKLAKTEWHCMKFTVIDSIVSEHIEEASFLWLERSHAVHAPNYGPQQFADLDERLEAHIDGLRVAGDEGWKLCEQQMITGEPEDLFPAAALAIESKYERLDQIFAHVSESLEALPGLISAFGWVSDQFINGIDKELLESDFPLRRLVGIAVCSMHRKNLGANLDKFLADPSPSVHARALRIAGELGRTDVLNKCVQASKDDNPKISFWAAWAAVLLGDRDTALDVLMQDVMSQTLTAERALRLSLCAMDPHISQVFLQKLTQNSTHQRLHITGTGLSGDPQYIPWLLKQMEEPETARLAGEAFTLITGLDINLGDFEKEGPEDFEAGPTEEPEDEDIIPDLDTALPWPNTEKIEAWWQNKQNQFQPGQRYFLGELLSVAQCQAVLCSGYQRQRVIAALHLALLQPGSILFPTRVPAWRQQRLLQAEEKTKKPNNQITEK